MCLQDHFFLFSPPSLSRRSQGKKEEAVILLRDSIKYGPEFADAYSSLASLLAEQVMGIARALVPSGCVYALLPQPQHLLHIPVEHPRLAHMRWQAWVRGCLQRALGLL